MSQNKNNPYSRATGAYDQNAQSHTTDQRELEARVLLKSNKMLKDLVQNWDSVNGEILEETLKYNRQIWMLFYDTAIENKGEDHTSQLRSNIVNLANFIFKREMEILSDPQKEKLDILISINSEIAAGLMTGEKQTSQTASPTAPPPASGHTTDISG